MWTWAAIAMADVPAPKFVGAREADAALLATAWQEIARCAGWAPPHHPEVPVLYPDIRPRWAGRAHTQGGRLTSIELIEGHAPTTIVHEVGHAWTSFRPGTPDGLSEGLTDLLVDCVARNRPDLGLRPRPPDEVTVDDLTAWSTNGGDTMLDLGPGYSASIRVARLARDVVGERALWPDPTTPHVDWIWLSERLASVPPGATQEAVLEALGPGADKVDIDGDGVSTEHERADGTLPWDIDSDDDGVLDGVGRRPRGAWPLIADGVPTCAGLRATDDAASFAFEVQGPDAAGIVIDVVTPIAELRESLTSIPVRRGDDLYLRATVAERAVVPRAPVWVRATGVRDLKRDGDCPVAGRRAAPGPDQVFVPVFVRPPPDDAARWIDAALTAGDAWTGVSGDRSRVPVALVRDPLSATTHAASAWIPEQETTLQKARARVVARRLARDLALDPYRMRFPGPSDVIVAEVADHAAPGPEEVDAVAWWLELLSLRLMDAGLVIADESWERLLARLDRFPDDRVLAELASLAHAPLPEVDPSVAWETPRETTPLHAQQRWQCSGWRSAGNPPFDRLVDGHQGMIDLTSWDEEGRIVGGGRSMSLWRAGGRRDHGCGEAGGIVWITAAGGPAPPGLVAALEARPVADPEAPFPVLLGGPVTGERNRGVVVADDLLAWGASTGEWGVVAATIAFERKRPKE